MLNFCCFLDHAVMKIIPEQDTEVFMPGYDKPMEWVDTGSKLWGMSVKIPEEMLKDPAKIPCEYAWVLRFRYDKNNKHVS